MNECSEYMYVCDLYIVQRERETPTKAAVNGRRCAIFQAGELADSRPPLSCILRIRTLSFSGPTFLPESIPFRIPRLAPAWKASRLRSQRL